MNIIISVTLHWKQG